MPLSRSRAVAPFPQISRFLLTRGLWLVLLELTVVAFGWYFTWRLVPATAGVIWALGCSMLIVAALVSCGRANIQRRSIICS